MVGSLDNFQIEEIPTKMILVNPNDPNNDINLIVYHAGNYLFLIHVYFRGSIRSQKTYN